MCQHPVLIWILFMVLRIELVVTDFKTVKIWVSDQTEIPM